MFLGIDFGTSGCRASVINARHTIEAEASVALPPVEKINAQSLQTSDVWLSALRSLLKKLRAEFDLSLIQRIAIDGTSSSVLITDSIGHPLTPALMYNDSSSRNEVSLIQHACPQPEHLCMSASSSLAKAIQLIAGCDQEDIRILHQADFLSNYLADRWGTSDYHNALKLGFDVMNISWPQWIEQMLPENCLPQVLAPGELLGPMNPELANEFGFSESCDICAGSTDANAAFIASGCNQAGDAVTSLGSTLVIKILNAAPIEDLTTGVYSHKLGDFWLCGGASNAGAAILLEHFEPEELVELSRQINPDQLLGLNYYPMTGMGERFPSNDPNKAPRIEPKPDSKVDFLQGLLEGLSDIERQGYEKLQQLGATKSKQILTSGGGAQNPQWTQLRSSILGVPVKSAQNTQASYGAALLACHGLKDYQHSTQ